MKSAGINPKMAKQLHELQRENSRLKKPVADQGPESADPQGGGPPTRLRGAAQLTCLERRRQTVESVGWRVNFKRVHRIWKAEQLQVPAKQQKHWRLPGWSANGCVRHRAPQRNRV